MNTALLSSNRMDWGTPWSIFNPLNEAIGGFDFDVCALPHNAKVLRFYTPEDNGLQQPWWGKCWMNPPYGRDITAWVRKAFESANLQTTVVGLLPARTDTKWFHDYVPFERVSYEMFLYRLQQKIPRSCICFLRGRVKFEGAEHPAPFPSMLVLWGV